MLLSKLVYLAIKNVIYYDDDSFTYENFLNGSFRNDPDYATSIKNVFSPINEAIARLNDLERIPYQIEEYEVGDSGVILLGNDVMETIAVANEYGFKIEHRPYGITKIKVFGALTNNVSVEYKIDIPAFDQHSYDYARPQPIDVDLKAAYGITDAMCNYIIEYAQGKLQEPIAPELANMHITRAEQYFANIRPVSSAFAQKFVYANERIE